MKKNKLKSIAMVVLFVSLPIIYLVLSDNKEPEDSSDKNPGTHIMPDGTVMDDMMHSMDMEEQLDDRGFINSMIPHHQEAVNTSDIIITKSNNPELIKLAQEIKDTQSKEIEDMKLWYQEWFQEKFVIGGEYMSMMRDLSAFDDITELEQVYIEDMIIHHQGAISMANNILESTEKQELIDFANSILEVQTKEVDILESLKK